MWYAIMSLFFFQAEDGIRDLVRSRGLGDVYKRQAMEGAEDGANATVEQLRRVGVVTGGDGEAAVAKSCLLYTSDAADERSSVDLGGRRIIKKKNTVTIGSEET